LLRLMEQRFRLGGSGDNNAGSVITVITPHDVDAIFDALQARGCDDGDPYWARVWPSAVALAECLLRRPELVRGRRVADVGAGLGVAGIAAALAGAHEVVLLDREPLALECARLSAEATAVAAAAGGGGQAAFAVSPEQFVPVFGDGDDGAGELTSAREVLGLGSDDGPAAPNSSTASTTVLRCERFDWHQRPLPATLRQSFDVVVACDVLYERDAVEPLAEVVPLLLAKSSRSGGGNGRLLLLADPPARTAQHREQFLSLLSAASGGGMRFVVDESSLEQCAPRQLDRELLGGEAEGKPVPVQLLHLRAAEGNDTVGLKL
jgi:predicted nicotinamide N-methyase